MSEARTWMKIHTGILSPEHRLVMGVRVWLFMYIIDRADWETGVAYHYRDQEAADALDMALPTVRRWRRDLEETGYITCRAGDQCQHIIIHRWRNPRKVNAEQQNLPGGCSKMITPPARKVITPTLYSESDHNGKRAACAAPVGLYPDEIAY